MTLYNGFLFIGSDTRYCKRTESAIHYDKHPLYCSVAVMFQGYKLTKQGKSIAKMGWNQVTSAAQGGKMLSTMTMETNSLTSSEMDASTMPKEHRLFKREVSVFCFRLSTFRNHFFIKVVFVVVTGDTDHLLISEELLC